MVCFEPGQQFLYAVVTPRNGNGRLFPILDVATVYSGVMFNSRFKNRPQSSGVSAVIRKA
jgi:hypothetical protein